MSTTETKVVVTARPKAPRDKSIVETPAGKKDLQVIIMGWAHQAVVRTMRTYVQTVLGNLANVGVVGAVAVTAFANLSPEEHAAIQRAYSALEFWQVLLIAFSTAVAPAVVTFLHNAIELLAKLDEKGPEWRA